jgi:phospholipid N-methyltransferase
MVFMWNKDEFVATTKGNLGTTNMLHLIRREECVLLAEIEQMNIIQFLNHFLRSPSITGAVAPSSNQLADIITDVAQLHTAQMIIEFGPGTGVFTEKILEKKLETAKFFAIEINPDFVTATKLRCPGIDVYHDSAVHSRPYLEKYGVRHCDRILCGLPWASFPEKLQDDLLATIVDMLQEEGMFLTFAYLQGLVLPAGWRFRKKLYATFSHVHTTPIAWRNIPPAFVYCATL